MGPAHTHLFECDLLTKVCRVVSLLVEWAGETEGCREVRKLDGKV